MRAASFAVVLVASSACGGDDTTTPPDAQAQSFELRIENVAPWTMLKSGTVDTGTGGMPGPLGPGDSFELTFTAGEGQAVSFALMLGESNDWFFAPGEAGIALYDPRTGEATRGDVTAQVGLWNAGTELDQEPAVGDATAPRQPRADFGADDPDPTVREVPMKVTLADGSTFTRPAVDDMIGVELQPGDARSFTLTITNRSTDQTLVTSQGARAVHLSPLAWSLHQAPAPLFTAGQPDRGEGLERIAEEGTPAELGASLAARSGFATPLSPGVYVVHREGSEVDQEPAIGPDTAPQQPAPGTGAPDPDGTVRAAAYDVAASRHVRVTLTPR